MINPDPSTRHSEEAVPELRDLADSATQTSPFVSVIIPVYNDGVRLRSCLQALEQQTYQAGRYEIIVVDNGSDEPVAPIVAAFWHARLTTEPRPGSYAARNRGISLARGDIIAFTDSDCVPSPSWLMKGVESLLGPPNCGFVGGRIDVLFKDPERPSAWELFTSLTSWQQRTNVEVEHFGATANLFTFKAVLDKVGWFDSTLKSHGDVVWCQRVFAAGYMKAYADDARLAHPAVESFGRLARRVTRQAGGQHDVRSQPGATTFGITKGLYIDRRQFGRFLARVMLDPRARRPQDKAKVFGVMLLAQVLVLSERLRLRLGGTSRR